MAFQQYAHFPTIFIAIFRAHCKKFFMHAYVVHNDAMTNDMLCEADFLIFFYIFFKHNEMHRTQFRQYVKVRSWTRQKSYIEAFILL